MGTITDQAGSPLNEALVGLTVAGASAATTRTGDNGRFFVTGKLENPSTLLIRRMGYFAREIALQLPRDTTAVLIIRLESSDVAALDSLTRADDAPAWLRGFMERRAANHFGRYFTVTEILAKNPHFTSEVLRGTPGVTLTPARLGYNIRMRNCRYAPILWMDGSRTPNAELDDIARAGEVAAMEVYTSPAGVPPEFQDRSNLGCGTILIWTRL